MEGISHEACSLAGTLRLGKLIAFYDDNGISIDGEVHGWFTDDTPKRFEAYGWHVMPERRRPRRRGGRGARSRQRRRKPQRPTLICCKTIIGWGAPNKQGTEATHGAALGEAEVAATREAARLAVSRRSRSPTRFAPAGTREAKGASVEQAWQQRFAAYRAAHPELAAEFERRMRGELPADWRARAGRVRRRPRWPSRRRSRRATRRSRCSNALGAGDPGAARRFGRPDRLEQHESQGHRTTVSAADAGGNYIHYGVREFGMTAIMNGIALHGGFIPYGGTFLVFSDYARNAVRMAALMKQRVDLRLHARFDRPRRGRPDAPADRAPARACA